MSGKRTKLHDLRDDTLNRISIEMERFRHLKKAADLEQQEEDREREESDVIEAEFERRCGWKR